MVKVIVELTSYGVAGKPIIVRFFGFDKAFFLYYYGVTSLYPFGRSILSLCDYYWESMYLIDEGNYCDLLT